jgi:NAD(P)-dependent dehydrogenase (short-subunit alcohol dehydrogenase family)
VSQNASAAVAIVTGAAEGLGQSIVDRLLADGYRVVASDINESIHARSGSTWNADLVRTVKADVASRDSGTVLVDQALSAFGRLDAIVNNAGVGGPSATVQDVVIDDILRVFDVNLLGALRLCQAAIPHLKAQGSGRIVNMGSLFADQPVPEASAYCMSKAAIRSLSEVLALELGSYGITVNTVAPGFMLTKMHLAAIASQALRLGVTAEERESTLRNSVPLKRHGTGMDVAGAVAWLLSSDASYVTGQTIGVNGGVFFR